MASNMLSIIILVVLLFNYGSAAKQQTPRPHNPLSPVEYPPDFCQNMTGIEHFDYIVIGSGPAGATVARRLAEDPDIKVLILEAGDDPPSELDIPIYFSKKPPAQSALWNIAPEKSNNTYQGYPNNMLPYTLAKMLGGCSDINAMMYIRGNHEDYNEWERLGGKGWGFKNMLHYFRKLENYVSNGTYDKKYHSAKGPFTTTYYPPDPQTFQLRLAMEDALKKSGIPINSDVNGKSQIGFGEITGIIEETGYRNNIVKSYLLNIPDNLNICKKSLVTKLVLNGKLKPSPVVGVEFIYNGSEKKTLKAREYIIAGGPANTPQILERSGIGQKNILKKAGVKHLIELNGVGENLQEQYANQGCMFTLKLNNQVAPNPLTTSLLSFTGFLNMSDFGNPVPDLQFGFSLAAKEGGLATKLEFQKQLKAKFDGGYSILIAESILLRQSNVGSVHIQTTNPLDKPIFNPKQYTTESELKLQAKGCRFMRKVFKNANKKYQIEPLILDKCKKHPANSDEEFICAVKLFPFPMYHLAGTAKMGPMSDSMAVVDERLRVHGVSNLRVVDLSVMPLVPRGNTEVPTIAVAERAADLILKRK